MDFAIYTIEQNDVDRRHIESLLKKLSHPVRIMDPAELDAGRSRIDIVIVGLSEGGADITDVRARLSRIRSLSPRAQVILCTPQDTQAVGTNILDLEARAYLLKPLDESAFLTLLNKILSQMQRRKRRDEYLKDAQKSSRISEVIGRSDAMAKVMSLVERVATSMSTSVLLLGETVCILVITDFRRLNVDISLPARSKQLELQ